MQPQPRVRVGRVYDDRTARDGARLGGPDGVSLRRHGHGRRLPSGDRRQQPLWASTSTKNLAYPDTRYVDELIGPDTVNTLPEVTIAAFADHGTLARPIDAGVDEAAAVMRGLGAVGVDMDDVGLTLENQGVAGFHTSYQQVLAALAAKARHLSRR